MAEQPDKLLSRAVLRVECYVLASLLLVMQSTF